MAWLELPALVRVIHALELASASLYGNFVEIVEVARRTGRFPQLVDRRSSVNGLFLTGSPGFREVSLEERGSLCRLKSLPPITPLSYRDGHPGGSEK
jgi:hypothetical protein